MAAVMHYQRTSTSAYCGRRLPTAGFSTDDRALFLETTADRCQQCRKAMAIRGLVDRPLPARPAP
jgi:hypothetical protein